jgi:hypothetical protein
MPIKSMATRYLFGHICDSSSDEKDIYLQWTKVSPKVNKGKFRLTSAQLLGKLMELMFNIDLVD